MYSFHTLHKIPTKVNHQNIMNLTAFESLSLINVIFTPFWRWDSDMFNHLNVHAGKLYYNLHIVFWFRVTRRVIWGITCMLLGQVCNLPSETPYLPLLGVLSGVIGVQAPNKFIYSNAVWHDEENDTLFVKIGTIWRFYPNKVSFYPYLPLFTPQKRVFRYQGKWKHYFSDCLWNKLSKNV